MPAIVRFVLLLVLFMSTSCAAPARPEHLPAITVERNRLMSGWRNFEVRGINYIHTIDADLTRCPQIQFGADPDCPWDINVIQRDLDRLAALGINTIRVFLNYYVFGGASKTNADYDTSLALSHFDALLAAANQRGIYVMPVLLQKYPQDRFAAEHYETALRVHVRPVVQHLAGRPGIIGWDLFNEPDIGSPVTIRCWDWSNADDPRCFQLAEERLQFLKVVHDEVKALDPLRWTTIGLAFAKSHAEPAGTSLRIADIVDVFSFHYYDNEPKESGRYAQHWYYGEGFPADLRRSINEIEALGLAKPILVTEIGFPSGPGHLRTPAEMERDQLAALRLAREEAISGLMFWQFTPTPEATLANLYR
jgi:endo-1,4-beta-mannosidase